MSGGLARTVESQDADFRSVVKGQRRYREGSLALDLLRDADHRENDLGSSARAMRCLQVGPGPKTQVKGVRQMPFEFEKPGIWHYSGF